MARRGYTVREQAMLLFSKWHADYPMQVDADTARELSGIEIEKETISLAALAMKTAIKNRKEK